MSFVKGTWTDSRIPKRDRTIIIVLIVYILSPFDFIPDFIFPFGIFDDVVALGIICDYFFQFLDRNLLLNHWPGSLKSFNVMYRMGRALASVAPAISRRLWLYKPSPY